MWKYLASLGPCASNDRLAVLNLLVFAVSVADGYCCPRRPSDFVGRVLAESLVTPGHLDLWMKDLSPDDSRVRKNEKREKALVVLPAVCMLHGCPRVKL